MSEKRPLTQKQKAWIGWIILSVITTVITLTLGVSFPIPPVPTGDVDAIALGTTHFTNLEAEDVAVTDDLTVTDAATVGGALSVTGAATVGGAFTQSGLTVLSSTEVTLTDGITITPATTLYIFDSASAVTITLAACVTDGTPLVTFGRDANAIVINDTNVRTNDGAAQTINAYDTVTWMCVDTEWVELSETAGS